MFIQNDTFNSWKQGMRNNVVMSIYYSFMGLLFTVRSLPYYSQAGDQTWFIEQAKKLNYDYLGFAIDRYFSWSSRLLIESATMFFSVHQILFSIVVFILLFAFWNCLYKLFIFDDEKHKLFKLFVPIIFIVIFTGNFYSGAGLIPNMVNYFFPMASFIFAWFLILKDNKFYNIISIFFIVFACMQEQFTVLTFLIFSYFVISHFWKNKTINLKYLIFVIISTLGMLSVKLSPGNANREKSTIGTYFPNFDSLSVFKKLYNGFMETNRVLFLNNAELNFIFIFLFLLIILAVIKKKYLVSFLDFIVVYCVLLNKMGVDTPLDTVQKITNNHVETLLLALYPVFLSLLFLIILAFSTFYLFEDSEIGLFSLVLIIFGYLARMVVSFSPSVYVSGIRTFEPLILTVFIVILLMLNELKLFLKN